MFSSALKSLSASNISSNYSISPNPTCQSGPWRIHDAKKKAGGRIVSVFVFDRKSLEPQGGGFGPRSTAGSLKRAQDEVVDRLKKEASALARLRHPSILELAEPVEETRNGGLMFATEPVSGSLAAVLDEKSQQERMGDTGGRTGRFAIEDENAGGRKEFELDELEIQKGLLQVGKGLEFLHESAGLVHANLTPEAIMINAKSDWKISGLGFSSPPDQSSGAAAMAPIALSEVLNYDARLPRSVQLNMDYTSPDFVLDNSIVPAADMFSLGLVVISLYNSPHHSPIETSNSTNQYRRIFSSPSSVPTVNNNFLISQTFPQDIKSEVLPRLITRRPAQRFSAREFQQARYFDNVLVSTIRFLDTLPAKSPNEKSQFMRGLSRILSQFPKSVLEKKVLPALLEEMKDPDLLSLTLQNIFKTLDLVTNGRRVFCERIIPALRRVFLDNQNVKGQAHDRNTSKEGGLIILLENMSTITNNCSGRELKDDILPIYYISLQSPTHSLVDHSLQTLPTILPHLDFSTIKNELFPVIAQTFSRTTSMAIKIQGLYALNALCGGSKEPSETQDTGDGLDGLSPQQQKQSQKTSSSSAVLDKYTVQEKVMPLLKGIKTKEPAVMMAALAVFRQVGRVADSDFLAMEVLPVLWSFSLGPLLNLEQFKSFMTLIKSLSSRIESEQTRKLQELNASGSVGSRSSGVGVRNGAGANFGGADVNGAGFGVTGGENGADDFESLVTGRARANEEDLFGGGWGAETAMRPANNRASSYRSPQMQQQQQPPRQTASFSWSSNTSNTTYPSPLTGAGAARTITPDNAMNSFAALAPSRAPTQSFNQPLQPLQPTGTGGSAGSAGTMPSFQSHRSSMPLSPQPQARPSYASPTGSTIDWSAASSSQQQQSRNTSWNIAPPPSAPAGVIGVNGAGRAARPPGVGVGFGVNAGMQQSKPGMGQTQTQTQGQGQGQKQGMEKYESLI